jgi:hypothetical protein
VIRALGPLALGHLLSISAIVAFVFGLSTVIAINYVRPADAAILVLFGIFRFVWPRAHPRWVAMRVNSAELTLWSFLMSSAHGAGLMLFPLLLHISPDMCVSPMLQSAHPERCWWRVCFRSRYEAPGPITLVTGVFLIGHDSSHFAYDDYFGIDRR